MTKKKPKESLAELQKQREDIEALLASIEEAYSEGTMPEAQYQDVKAQNEEKLQEINEKLDKAAMEGGGEAPVPETPPDEPAAAASPEPPQTVKVQGPLGETEIPAKPTSEPAPQPAPATPPVQPPPQEPAPVAAPSPVEQPTEQVMEGEQKTQQISSATIEMPEEIREMIEGIKEGKIGGNAELLKRVEKVEIDIEKVKSFVDAMKEERTSLDERFQRVSEEVGEIRSNMNNMDGRVGELEIKSDESSDIIKNLKPQRISQALESREEDVKNIKSRIEKIEDVISNTLKRVGDIRNLLQSLGSIDNLANMSKDIAKKVILVDDSIKKMSRMSDRIDTIFGELNKRLEEFMFYKAKQQSLDEMTQDLMRNIEEMSTKMDGYVQKNDLNATKDFLLTKIEEAKTGASAAAAKATGPGAEIQKQIEELKELNVMLEEQKKSGALGETEYQKSKEANTMKMEELVNKLADVQTSPAPLPAAAPSTPPQPAPAGQAAPIESAAPATPPPEIPPEQAASPEAGAPQPAPAEPTPTIPPSELSQAEVPPETPPSTPAVEEKKELVKEATPFGEMYKLEKKTQPPEVKPLEKPAAAEAPKQEPEPKPAETEAPKEEKTKEEEPAEEPEEEPEEDEEITTSITKGMKKHERMLTELEDSFKKGLLSEKAYSRTKKLLDAMNN